MGKRKKAAKKPGGGRKNEPLPTTFPCLFCNHEKSVSVKIDKKSGVGQLNCKVCNQAYQTSVNYLSAAVDVYSDWVDACDTVAKEDAPGESRAIARPHQPSSQRPSQATRARSEDDLEDLIDDEGVEDDEFPDFAAGGGYKGVGVGGDDEY